jgi:hypothetical protein
MVAAWVVVVLVLANVVLLMFTALLLAMYAKQEINREVRKRVTAAKREMLYAVKAYTTVQRDRMETITDYDETE